jgi:hypothetical protein
METTARHAKYLVWRWYSDLHLPAIVQGTTTTSTCADILIVDTTNLRLTKQIVELHLRHERVNINYGMMYVMKTDHSGRAI